MYEGFDNYGIHIAISVTNSCPLRCAHCVSNSDPHTARGRPGLVESFEELCQTWPKVRHVTLTGGEPFHDRAELRRFAASCNTANVHYGVITGAFWSKSPQSCAIYLDAVPNIHSMTISTDTYHQAFVTMQHVRNAVQACRDRAIRVRVRLTHADPMNAADQEIEDGLLDFMDHEEIEYAPAQMYGRASENGIGLAYKRQNNEPRRKLGKCPSTGPHIFEDGETIPCCNTIVSIRGDHPLRFGNLINEGATGIGDSIRDNALFMAIKTLGFDWLREQIDSEEGILGNYNPISACDFCFDLCTDLDLRARALAIVQSSAARLLIESVLLDEYGDTVARNRIRRIATALLRDEPC